MKITNFINILFLVIFIFNINYVNSEDDIISLKDLYKQQNLKSEIGKLKYLSHFSLQCSSLFQAINEVLPNNNILLASINLREGAIISKIMLQKTLVQFLSIHMKLIQEKIIPILPAWVKKIPMQKLSVIF